jgi:hypothetical protein
MNYINIAAVALSPVIAVLVSLWVQDRREKRQTKQRIFESLIATRHAPITEENVRALNMIDVVFHDASGVRRLWHEYSDMLNNEGLNNPNGWSTRQKKNLELIAAMASVLGYGKAITHLDVDRVYYPVGLANQNAKAQQIADELLRVLRESGGVQFAAKDPVPRLPHGS